MKKRWIKYAKNLILKSQDTRKRAFTFLNNARIYEFLRKIKRLHDIEYFFFYRREYFLDNCQQAGRIESIIKTQGYFGLIATAHG